MDALQSIFIGFIDLEFRRFIHLAFTFLLYLRFDSLSDLAQQSLNLEEYLNLEFISLQIVLQISKDS